MGVHVYEKHSRDSFLQNVPRKVFLNEVENQGVVHTLLHFYQ